MGYVQVLRGLEGLQCSDGVPESEDEGTRSTSDTGNYTPSDMLSHPRRNESSATLRRVPQISPLDLQLHGTVIIVNLTAHWSQNSLFFLWQTEVHSHVQKGKSLVPVLSQAIQTPPN